jgi:hypothetical protein
LCEEAAAGGVQARKGGVLLGRAGVADLEREAVVGGRSVDHQLAVGMAERHALAVDQHAQQVELVAVQLERLARWHGGVALDLHAAGDQRLGGVEIEGQVDLADPVGRGCVVLAADDGGGSFAHGGGLSVMRAFGGACVRWCGPSGPTAPASGWLR